MTDRLDATQGTRRSPAPFFAEGIEIRRRDFVRLIEGLVLVQRRLPAGLAREVVAKIVCRLGKCARGTVLQRIEIPKLLTLDICAELLELAESGDCDGLAAFALEGIEARILEQLTTASFDGIVVDEEFDKSSH